MKTAAFPLAAAASSLHRSSTAVGPPPSSRLEAAVDDLLAHAHLEALRQTALETKDCDDEKVCDYK